MFYEEDKMSKEFGSPHFDKDDVSQKQAYAELNQVFDTIADGIRVTDSDFNILRVNNAFCSIVGKEKHEIIGKKCFDVFGISKCHTENCPFNQILKGRECVEYDIEKECGGANTSCIVTATPLRDQNGRLTGMVAIFKDITERKLIEDKLYEQKEFTEKLLQNSSIPTFVLDSQHKVIMWNRACELLTHKKASEVKTSEDISMIFYGHNRPFLASLIIDGKSDDISRLYNKYKKSEIIQNGFQGESWFTNIDGQKKYLVFEAAPIYSSTGEIIAVIETLLDITERKSIEEELDDQKKFTENLLQNSSVPTFVINSQHEVIIWNRACEKLSGIMAPDLTDTGDIASAFYGHKRPLLADIVLENKDEDLTVLYKNFKKSEINPGGIQSESWLKSINRKDSQKYEEIDERGQYYIFEAAPIYNSEGEKIAVIETLNDITERKLAEEALLEKNQSMQKELELAAKVQHELLPQELPEVYGTSFAWEFKPSIYVAGDIFNIFKLGNNHVGFYILDVMGHGVQAALKAVTISYFLKPISNQNKCSQVDASILYSPSEVLNTLNERFSSSSKNVSFFTIFYGILNLQNNMLTYARAGHCPPIVITNDKEITELGQGGPAVGLSKDAVYKDYIFELMSRDKLLLYTDGITDAKNSLGQLFSKERFIEIINRSRTTAISDLISLIAKEASVHLGSKEAEDDITLLGIELIKDS